MVLLVYNNGVAFVSRGAKPVEDPVAAIERGEIAPIYCLYGAERYQVDRCLAALREAVVGGKAAAFAAFNHDAFDLKETSLAAVSETARTLPMMAPRRLGVGKGIDGVKSDDLAPLVPYAGDPNPSTCLVLVGEKIDTRFKAFQVLRKAGYLHEFAALRALPGIGPYTAAALASIAFGEWPLAELCEARRLGIAPELPIKSAPRPKQAVSAVCARVQRAGRVLLIRRQRGLLAGTWTLPAIERAG